MISGLVILHIMWDSWQTVRHIRLTLGCGCGRALGLLIGDLLLG
jgi:hypothetical protein